jgi:hypothetical protein
LKIELSVYEDNFSMTVEVPESRQATAHDSALVGSVVEALGLGPIVRLEEKGDLYVREPHLPLVVGPERMHPGVLAACLNAGDLVFVRSSDAESDDADRAILIVEEP